MQLIEAWLLSLRFRFADRGNALRELAGLVSLYKILIAQ